jgi:hypothetical protein
MATAAPEYIKPGDDDEVEEVESSSSAISAIEEADRSHMIRTAKANPRVITDFIKELTAIACFNRATAMEMMYSIPRDGKQLIGPSIGFAEAALAIWGNARAGSEVVETNPHEGYVVAEGRYYDCEKNVGRAIRKRRRVVAKRITADAIQVTGDAACSIATREAILRSIPKPLWKPVWEKAKQTAVGEIKGVDVVRVNLVQTFNKIGVTNLQICNALNVAGIPDIGPDEIIALQLWHKQLEEKACTIEDLFGSPEDVEIEQLMTSLQWADTKKAMSRDAYKGRRDEHLAYLRQQAQAAGIAVGSKAQATVTEQKKQPEPPKPEEKQQEQPQAEQPNPLAGADLFGGQQQQQQSTQQAPPKQQNTAAAKPKGKFAW